MPKNLNDKHKDFPMAPEKLKVSEKMLAPFQLQIKKEHGIEIGITKKLIPNLYPKKNYVVHYRKLKYYLSKRWILTKVHKILEFKQSPWMKPYNEFNTERRKEATNEADKNIFKLLNNAVYGKTMENMKKTNENKDNKNTKTISEIYIKTYIY